MCENEQLFLRSPGHQGYEKRNNEKVRKDEYWTAFEIKKMEREREQNY